MTGFGAHIQWIVAAWLAGVLAFSLWNLGGWFAVHRLRQRTVSPSQEHISFADAMRVAGTVSSVDSISHPDEKPENGP